jgi:glycosyltransferase involved in cell wall biosynthesis
MLRFRATIALCCGGSMTDSPHRPRVATIITTRDEAVHIERAVASALSLGTVVVVDSGSTDDTRGIAARAGAVVLEREWGGYSRQKNWARDNLPVNAEWVFHLDADERLTPALKADIERRIVTNDHAGYYVAREYVFYGRVLRHAWWYPDYQLRLFRPDRGRYEDRAVHEHVVLDGSAGFLAHPLIHENIKSIREFIARHARYADLEAAEILRRQRGPIVETREGRLLGSWPDRRRALKTDIWYRMPFRPAIRFLWLYVLKRGFLDGREGLVFCQLIAAYEAMIDAALLEQKRLVSGASPA